MSTEIFKALRQQMVAEVVAETIYVCLKLGKAALDSRVIEAINKVPRHRFVPLELQPYAYLNRPLPIGFDKTISQPFIVALMTDLLALTPNDRVLEIGTGLGYQAAVLAELAQKVYTIEIIDELAAEAKQRFGQLGYLNVSLKTANGYNGWPEHSPFDKVILTAAPPSIPESLLSQLKAGGKMVLPVGPPNAQQLLLVEKNAKGKITVKEIMPVRFSALESD